MEPNEYVDIDLVLDGLNEVTRVEALCDDCHPNLEPAEDCINRRLILAGPSAAWKL